MIPPVVGPTTTSISLRPYRRAISLQIAEACGGRLRRSNFSMYWSLWRPEDRRKCPCFSAPDARSASRTTSLEFSTTSSPDEIERDAEHEIECHELRAF